MAEPPARAEPTGPVAGIALCASAELAERGRAVLFDVLHRGEALRGFVLRIDGTPQAYLNRCAHLPVELDWQPGEFLDAERTLIVCSMHGAVYAPETGRCLGGPCADGRLLPVAVAEADGQVRWYPSADTQPAFAD